MRSDFSLNKYLITVGFSPMYNTVDRMLQQNPFESVKKFCLYAQ